MKCKLAGLTILALVFLMCFSAATAEEAATLKLPADLEVIEEEAFYGDSSFRKVIVPEGTTRIGARAFADSALWEIELPNSVTFIDDSAFAGVESVRITADKGSYAYGWAAGRDNVQLVSDGLVYSFADGAARVVRHTDDLPADVVVPAEVAGYPVTAIGMDAFFGCDTLVRIEIPYGVTEIGDWVFGNCSNLMNVILPDGLVSIGECAFSECDRLTDIRLPKGLESIGAYAFSYTSLRSVEIPDSVTEIGDGAFSYCSKLLEIAIPDSVTSIPGCAFEGCRRLYAVCIPGSVKSIDDFAFEGCNSMLTIVTPQDSYAWGWAKDHGLRCSASMPERTTEGDVVYLLHDGIATVMGYTGSDTRVEIPASVAGCPVTEIGEWAFYACRDLTEIILPYSLTAIGEGSFCGCESLPGIVIPKGVTCIPREAFDGCTLLTNVSIPVGVTSIEDEAFLMCFRLAEVVLPDGLVSIGMDAFYECPQLTTVVVPGSVTSIDESAFNPYNDKLCIIAPENSCAADWARQHGCRTVSSLSAIQKENGVIYIQENGTMTVLGYTHELPADVVLPAYVAGYPVTAIGPSAFSYCDQLHSHLRSIVIPNGVTTIGEHAFYFCRSLTSINLPDSMTSIGEEAFEYCSSLTAIRIPASVTEIGNWAIPDNKNLTIYGTAGSCAESYAASKSIRFSTDPWNL